MKLDCPHHENCFFHGDFESVAGCIGYEDHLLQTERNQIFEKWFTEIVGLLRGFLSGEK